MDNTCLLTVLTRMVLFGCILCPYSMGEWFHNSSNISIFLNDKEKATGISDASINNATLDSCTSSGNQLLSNLYVDYFRSYGSCTLDGVTIVRTFHDKNQGLSDLESEKMVEQLCRSIPSLCQLQGKRSSRLLVGLTQRALYHLHDKAQKVLDYFNGRDLIYGPTHQPYNYPHPSFPGPPFLNAIFSPQHVPYPNPPFIPPQHSFSPPKPHVPAAPPAPPAPPPKNPNPSASYPSFPAPALPPSPAFPSHYGFPFYYPYPQPLPQYQQKSEHSIASQDQPLYDLNCSPSGGCIKGSLTEISNQKRSITKQQACQAVTNIVFPMVGKSIPSNKTIKILQRFPQVLQPVSFRICRTKYPAMVQGRCVQEYLPVSFFTEASQQSSSEALHQEFVLVESGCRLED